MHASWNIAAILEGNRSCFGPGGPKEHISREMILKAEEGDYNWIFGVLRNNLACADVSDSKGYTVLAAAAVSPFSIGTLPRGLPCVVHSSSECLTGASQSSAPNQTPPIQV